MKSKSLDPVISKNFDPHPVTSLARAFHSSGQALLLEGIFEKEGAQSEIFGMQLIGGSGGAQLAFLLKQPQRYHHLRNLRPESGCRAA